MHRLLGTGHRDSPANPPHQLTALFFFDDCHCFTVVFVICGSTAGVRGNLWRVFQYGAHALDTLQAMVERRGPLAAESGVAAVQCLEGAAVWAAGRAGRFSMRLAKAAVGAVVDKAAGVDLETFEYGADLPATAFIVEYRDGFRGTVLMLSGVVNDHGYAACTKSDPGAISCRRDCHCAAPPSPFSRCINADGEGITVK